VIARTAGRENRREKAADNADRGKRDRILAHGEPARQHRDDKQKRKRRSRRQQRIELERGEDGEVQDADAAALQDHCVRRPALAPGIDVVGETAVHVGGVCAIGACSAALSVLGAGGGTLAACGAIVCAARASPARSSAASTRATRSSSVAKRVALTSVTDGGG